MPEPASRNRNPGIKHKSKAHHPKQETPIRSTSARMDSEVTRDVLKTLESSLDELRSLVTCRICLRLLYEPYTIACGHTFCYGCLSQWFVSNKARRTCPDCRHRVSHQPAPAYMVREMTQVFISRVELLPGGETTDDHKKWQREEMELVERDKNNHDRTVGGLFRGSFKSPFLNRRAIRDNEDGVERCPRCMWELEDGLCIRCHVGLDSDGMMAEDFSDLDDRLSTSTFDGTDEEMDLDIDMEEGEADIDPDLWTQDDSDISLDGDGRPIHTGREFAEGGWGIERRGAQNAGGHARAAGVPRMAEAVDWEHGGQRWPSDGPLSDTDDEGEEVEQDDEAGSLDEFVVDDNETIASRSQGSPGSGPSTISHTAYEGRAPQLDSIDSNRSSHEPTAQQWDEDDSDEGGGVSNGRRRMRSGRSQSHRRNVIQRVPSGFPIPNTSENEGDSDGATDTLLQAGWSQLGQDEHEENHHGSDILSGRTGVSNIVDMSRAAAGNDMRHAAPSPRNTHRHRSHILGARLGRLHRGEPASGRSNQTPQPSSGRSRQLPESAPSNADFVRRATAPHTRRRREASVASISVDASDVSNMLSEEDSFSDRDLPYLEQFSPLASSSNTSAATSRASSRDPSGTRVHHWQQHPSESSEASGYETPSGNSPHLGHRASSETATATVGGSSSVVGSATALRLPTTRTGPQSPIYINSSPVKSGATPSSADQTSTSKRSESPISNRNMHRRRQISPRADLIPHRNSQGRPRGQTPATILQAFNSRLELQNRLSRHNIRGGGGFPTGASPSRYARQPTQSPEEREREQAAAEKAAEKAARRRAKDLWRQQQQQQQHNPFLSAQSRLSRASRLINEAADRYSDLQAQPGPSNRVENFNLRDAEALWGVEEAGDRDDEIW